MQFSYRPSKAIWFAAYKLNIWTMKIRLATGFWALGAPFGCFLLIQHARRDFRAGSSLIQFLGSSDFGNDLFITLGGLTFVIFVLLLPWWKASYGYRKSAGRDGMVHITLTSDGCEVAADAGASASLKWNFYKFWREGKTLFTVTSKSGVFQFLPKVGLSDAQIQEMRGILSAALPEK